MDQISLVFAVYAHEHVRNGGQTDGRTDVFRSGPVLAGFHLSQRNVRLELLGVPVDEPGDLTSEGISLCSEQSACGPIAVQLKYTA